MFGRIESLILQLFTDMQSTFIWIFAIGVLFCTIMISAGDDQNAPKFKKGLILCIAGVVVFLLARPIIEYVQNNL